MDPLSELSEFWSSLCEDKYSLSKEGLSSVRSFLKKLPSSEIKGAMEIAADRFNNINDIEKRFQYFCGICTTKITALEGDKSIEVFNKARYYFLKQRRGSGYLVEEQLRVLSRRYSLETIKEAIDVAFSAARDNYWQAVCDALSDITGDTIEF